jgi:hypothetical protein
MSSWENTHYRVATSQMRGLPSRDVQTDILKYTYGWGLCALRHWHVLHGHGRFFKQHVCVIDQPGAGHGSILSLFWEGVGRVSLRLGGVVLFFKSYFFYTGAR